MTPEYKARRTLKHSKENVKHTKEVSDRKRMAGLAISGPIDLRNPYSQGNWAGVKLMKRSTGTSKNSPQGPVLHQTNTPPPELQTVHDGGMATPLEGKATV